MEPINGGIKTDDGKYIVTFSVPELTRTMTNVKLLHYSTDRDIWEIITPNEVNYEQKQITAEFIDLSPVAVIADVDKTQAEGSEMCIRDRILAGGLLIFMYFKVVKEQEKRFIERQE